MATPVQTQQPPPPREDPKKEEARKEEQEKRNLEQELMDFDAHAFYDRLLAWAEKEIPKPYKRTLHVSLFRIKQVLWQPLPLTRADEKELLSVSTATGKVLSLLRRIDQKGLECPYVHQVNKAILEQAVDKCDRLKEASGKYLQTKGLLARISQFFHKNHVLSALKDVEYLKRRLESIIVMCRHQEFAQDLMRLRREVTFRTGNILKDEAPSPAAAARPKSEIRRAPAGLKTSARQPSPTGGQFFQPASKPSPDQKKNEQEMISKP